MKKLLSVIVLIVLLAGCTTTAPGEYQLYVAGDSLYFYDQTRKVAVLHCNQVGTLDSVIIADNQ